MSLFTRLLTMHLIGVSSAPLSAACLESTPKFADVLVQADGADGKGFGNPSHALNGVNGAGLNQGGLDVFSLNKTSDGILIAAFSGGIVCDGPGADLNVFENSFRERTSNALFFEPVVVSVSWDGLRYESFPHSYLGTEKPSEAANEKNWIGFAGLSPVFYNEKNFNWSDQGIDPLDRETAGGDSFDLQDLPNTLTGIEIKALGFRFVKLTAAPALGFPTSPSSFGGWADIDGIYVKRFFSP